MKRYILSIFTILICRAAVAQSSGEAIFRAMETELGRSMDELRMEEVGKPLWIGYIYADINVMFVSASLGQVVQSQLQPQRANAARVVFGSYGMTSDINYTSAYNIRGSAIETDEEHIRREFWFNTDEAYKQAAPNLARKATMRRQSVRTPDEEALPDLLPVAPAEKIVESPAFGFDLAGWEKRTAELSAVFCAYPLLYNSEVGVAAYEWINYAYTSERVRVQHPTSFACLTVKASVRTPDGESFSDDLEIYTTSDLTFPPQEELRKEIERFARNLSGYAEAPKIEEFYSGPVLFVGQPVFRMFDHNLLSTGGNALLVRRRGENANSQGGNPHYGGDPVTSAARRLENRLGQRVLDRKFTVTNRSALRQWDGIPLLGYYEIDADGIVPPEELVVIDAGILRTVLNGRIPTLKSPMSTGSNRFSVNLSPLMAPGTLDITASDTKSAAQLERDLVALAKSDGLRYAYIVEKMNGTFNLVWRIDVETAERTPVRNAEVTPVSLVQLKRVTGVSEESRVRNYLAGQVPSSMIYPSAILLEDIEIGELETKKEKNLPIANPLERTANR